MPLLLSARLPRCADVAELADALDSKSGTRKSVWVRPPPSAPKTDCSCRAAQHTSQSATPLAPGLTCQTCQESRKLHLAGRPAGSRVEDHARDPECGGSGSDAPGADG